MNTIHSKYQYRDLILLPHNQLIVEWRCWSLVRVAFSLHTFLKMHWRKCVCGFFYENKLHIGLVYNSDELCLLWVWQQRAESNIQPDFKVNNHTFSIWGGERGGAAIAETANTRRVRYGTRSDTSCHDIILSLGYLGRWDCSVLPWQLG